MSDLNNFFSNKRIMTATSIPTEGKFRKGDIIVNVGPDADKDSMWICVEEGTPGVWKTIGEVDLSNYATKEDLEEAKQLGNNVKQELVDALVAKGIPISTNGADNTFENLLSQITAYTSFTNRQSTYNVSVTAGQTLTLQNTTRGCYNFSITDPQYVKTDWGDGTIDNSLTHTYATAGTYTLATPYSFSNLSGVMDQSTMNSLVKVDTLRSPMTTMAYCCANAHNLTNKPVCGSGVKNMYAAYYNCTNMPGPAVCGANVTNMAYAYSNCLALTGAPNCGANVTNMCYAYYSTPINAAPVCGAKVTDMSHAYSNCTALTQQPVCGANVTDMAYAYYNCNLTNTPVCGAKVTDMAYAYWNCNAMTGTAVCGANVTNMSYAYCNCNGLTNTAASNANVKDMSYAYYNCRKINGVAPCSYNNITNLAYAFYYCINITNTGNIGTNVTNMSHAFYGCNKFTNSINVYVYSPNVTNALNCFYGKYANRYINVYVPANSTTLNTFIKNTAAESIYGKDVTWNHNASNSCYYNTTNGYRVKIFYTL